MHRDEKERLMEQMSHTENSLSAKQREAEEYKRLHSQVASTANQHHTNLQKTQDELTHMQQLYTECAHNLQEERSRAAARKCEDCSPLRTEVQNEQTQKAHLQTEIQQMRTQLSVVAAQYDQLKQNTIPKPVETNTHQQQGGGGGGGGGAVGGDAANQRTSHDDHIDAAIARHGQQQAVPTPVVDPNQQQHQQQQQQHQEQQQQQQVPVQQQQDGGGGQRRWSRGAGQVPVDASGHVDEHGEPVMTPDQRRLKQRGGGRRKGGLSMLEEHLGVEHEIYDAQEEHY